MERYAVSSVTSRDGLRLHLHCWGDATGSPLLLLHGGGQTGWAWEASANRLAALGYYCIAPDMRGHGDSAWADDGGYSIDAFADDVRGIALSCAVPPVAIGASLGGMSALMVAGDHQQGRVALDALLLVDITPRFERAGTRRVVDFMTAHPDGFATLDEAAAAVHAYLPHRGRRVRNDGLRKNLRQRRDRRWVWHWDPRMLDEARKPDAQWEAQMSAAARRLSLPTLLISGGMSDVVSSETVAEFLEMVPHARHIEIDDAHHMVAGDSNDAFTGTIIEFLAGSDPRKTA